jgi:hypothetical protein
VAELDVGRRPQRGGTAGPHDPALLDDVVPVGDAGQRLDVLVDDEDGLPGGLERFQAPPDLRSDERRQALGRLVEDLGLAGNRGVPMGPDAPVL